VCGVTFELVLKNGEKKQRVCCTNCATAIGIEVGSTLDERSLNNKIKQRQEVRCVVCCVLLCCCVVVLCVVVLLCCVLLRCCVVLSHNSM
jgi:hypothetical protein